MGLPKQIQAQRDAMAAYDKQVLESANPAPTEEPTPIETPPPELTPEPLEVTQAPAQPPKSDEPTWKQRYLSLQGQFNSQVPALQAQVGELSGKVVELMAKLQSQAPAEGKPKAAEAKQTLVTSKDVDAFGEDLVDLARRVAKEEVGGHGTGYQERIERLEAQLREAKGQVEGVAQAHAHTASERFFDRLSGAVPGWEQVQATAECQQFLASRVPGTQYRWNDALVNAAQRHDFDAVMEVFGVFFDRHPALNPKAVKQPSAARTELQRQVAPTRSAAAQSSSTPAKRSFTGSEYEAESMRIVRMNKAGKWDEAKRLQAELNAALAEGRVTP